MLQIPNGLDKMNPVSIIIINQFNVPIIDKISIQVYQKSENKIHYFNKEFMLMFCKSGIFRQLPHLKDPTPFFFVFKESYMANLCSGAYI